MVITWDLTEPFGSLLDFSWYKTVNRFQAVLHLDGAIEMSYKEMAANDAIVGIYPALWLKPRRTESPFPIIMRSGISDTRLRTAGPRMFRRKSRVRQFLSACGPIGPESCRLRLRSLIPCPRRRPPSEEAYGRITSMVLTRSSATATSCPQPPIPTSVPGYSVPLPRDTITRSRALIHGVILMATRRVAVPPNLDSVWISSQPSGPVIFTRAR